LGIKPEEINDRVITDFIAAVRQGSLHRKPNALHRQVTLIWNEAAADPALRLQSVTLASFQPPPKRIDWALLSPAFRRSVEDHLSWCAGTDPFAPDARSRPLASRTLQLRRDQIHAAVSSLVQSGTPHSSIRSLNDLVSPENFKKILRKRLEDAGDKENAFNHGLAKALIQIAREWTKVEAAVLAELKRLFSKMPAPVFGLTDKNKNFLRQFDDSGALQRVVELPQRLWAEVQRDQNPGVRTLAKAQAALGIAILTYMPLRLHNLSNLRFDTHLFLHAGRGATSTLEISEGEVKNKTALAFDVPGRLAKMMIEYRERILPKILGRRSTRLFVNVDRTPKSQATVAWLIASYLKRRAGIVMTPHQFRHLAAKIFLEAEPGSFELVKQVLGHKSEGDGPEIERCTWKAKYPTQEAIDQKRQELGDIGFRREMLLQIVPEEGQDVLLEDIHYYDDPPFDDGNYLAHCVDLAISTKESADYTAVVSGEVTWLNGKLEIYIQPHPVNRRVTFSETMEALDDIRHSSNMSSEFFVEAVTYQQAAIEEM